MVKINLGDGIKRETVQQAAYRRLKTAVLSGQLTLGEFYTENEFANVLSISRTPVREAIRDLINDGLLISIPRKGLRVREFTDIEAEQIFLVRKAIEEEVIEKFIETATSKQIDVLEKLIEQQNKAIDDENRIRFIELDHQFHLNIINYVDYLLVEEMIIKLHNLTRLIGHTAIMNDGRMKEVIDEHKAILNAVKSRDKSQGKAEMGHHLNCTKISFHRAYKIGK